jgi:hypothetical protein
MDKINVTANELGQILCKNAFIQADAFFNEKNNLNLIGLQNNRDNNLVSNECFIEMLIITLFGTIQAVGGLSSFDTTYNVEGVIKSAYHLLIKKVFDKNESVINYLDIKMDKRFLEYAKLNSPLIDPICSLHLAKRMIVNLNSKCEPNIIDVMAFVVIYKDLVFSTLHLIKKYNIMNR